MVERVLGKNEVPGSIPGVGSRRLDPRPTLSAPEDWIRIQEISTPEDYARIKNIGSIETNYSFISALRKSSPAQLLQFDATQTFY